jgi:hypothetical protein
LQNRLLAQVKSQRSINRFRILHGRLKKLKMKGGAARLKTDLLDLAPVVSMREPELAGLMSQMGSKADLSALRFKVRYSLNSEHS